MSVDNKNKVDIGIPKQTNENPNFSSSGPPEYYELDFQNTNSKLIPAGYEINHNGQRLLQLGM